LKEKLFAEKTEQKETNYIDLLGAGLATEKKTLDYHTESVLSRTIRKELSAQLHLRNDFTTKGGAALPDGMQTTILEAVAFHQLNTASDFLEDFAQALLVRKHTSANIKLSPAGNIAALTASKKPLLTKLLKCVTMTKHPIGFSTLMSFDTMGDAVSSNSDLTQVLEEYCVQDLRASIENAVFNATKAVHGFNGLLALAKPHTSTANQTTFPSYGHLITAAIELDHPQGITAYIREQDYAKFIEGSTEEDIIKAEKLLTKVVLVPYLPATTFAVLCNSKGFALGQGKKISARHKVDPALDTIKGSFLSYMDFQPVEPDKVHAVAVNYTV